MPELNKIIDADFKKKLGDRWEIFQVLHKLILSLNKKVNFRIFPIYITYHLKDKNIALIYYKGKFVNDGGLDIGLNLKGNPTSNKFIKAEYMHYPGITHSTKIKKLRDIDLNRIKVIKSIILTQKET